MKKGMGKAGQVTKVEGLEDKVQIWVKYPNGIYQCARKNMSLVHPPSSSSSSSFSRITSYFVPKGGEENKKKDEMYFDDLPFL